MISLGSLRRLPATLLSDREPSHSRQAALYYGATAVLFRAKVSLYMEPLQVVQFGIID